LISASNFLDTATRTATEPASYPRRRAASAAWRIFLATKFGICAAAGRDRKVDGRRICAEGREASLKRLGIDVIDSLLSASRRSARADRRHYRCAMKNLVEAGKVRYIGFSIRSFGRTISARTATHPIIRAADRIFAVVVANPRNECCRTCAP